MEKYEFLNGVREEYRQWQNLLDQIGQSSMEEPGVAGHWSIKDIVAHISGWRRRTVDRLRAVQHGEPSPPPPWPAHLQTDDEINAWIYEANHQRSVSEVLNDSDQVFQDLLSAIEGLPDQVLVDPQHYLPWLDGNPLTPATLFAHFHDEHEADMRAFLAQKMHE